MSQKLKDFRCPCGHVFHVFDADDWGAYGSRSFQCSECGWTVTLVKDFCYRDEDGRLRCTLVEDQETSRRRMWYAGAELRRRYEQRAIDLLFGD